MAVIVLAHGAWSAAWSWKKLRLPLAAAGHEFYAPTYTGLGERAHLARPENDLDTHIQDVLGVLKYEELRDVVLLGHSYGGMVATGVADRARERVARLVYLDAFVPEDGQALIDLLPERERQRHLDSVKNGDGWRVQPNPIPPDTSEDDVGLGSKIPLAAIGAVFPAAGPAERAAITAADLYLVHARRRAAAVRAIRGAGETRGLAAL